MLVHAKYVFLSLAFTGVLVFAKYEEPLEDLVARGVRLYEQREYDGALYELNKAMGRLKHTPGHSLYEEVSKNLRLTKAKLSLERFAKRRLSPSLSNEGLSPLAAETEDFAVTQSFGKVIARKVWEDLEVAPSRHLGIGRTVTVLPGAGVELVEAQGRNFGLRCVQAGSFSLSSLHGIDLHSGAYLIHSMRSAKEMKLKAVFSDLVVFSQYPHAFMTSVETNGGLKIIGLLGKIRLSAGSEELELAPGELVFCINNSFSRKMDVELSTLVATSKLLNDFSVEPVFMKKLKQQALIQALRTEKKFRTSVGDVKGNRNFELKLLPEK